MVRHRAAILPVAVTVTSMRMARVGQAAPMFFMDLQAALHPRASLVHLSVVAALVFTAH